MFKHVKLTTKIVISFISIVFLTCSLIGYNLISIQNMKTNMDSIYGDNLKPIIWLSEIRDNLKDIKSNMVFLLEQDNYSLYEEKVKEIDNWTKEDNEFISEYSKMDNMTPKEAEMFEQFKGALKIYRERRDVLLDCIKIKDYDKANTAFVNVTSYRDEAINDIEKLIELNKNYADQFNNEATVSYNRVRTISIIASLLIGILSIAIVIVIYLMVKRKIKNIIRITNNIGAGDFSEDIIVDSDDEFGQILKSLDRSKHNIKSALSEISASTEELHASNEELIATMEELLSQSESVKESTKQIVTGSEKLSNSTIAVTNDSNNVKNIVDKLLESSEESVQYGMRLHDKTIQIKEKGIKAMRASTDLTKEKTTNILAAIERSKVVDQIQVMANTIEAIANQSHMLSLNAQIEAARAGEQGRGFAVVAEEVKKLSEQSKHSVKEINVLVKEVKEAFNNLSENSKDLLSFIEKNVSEDYKLLISIGKDYEKDASNIKEFSEKSSQSYNTLLTSMNHVAASMEDISAMTEESVASSEEILSSIEETTLGINQITQAVQDQATLGQKLNELVEKFKL